MTIYPVHTEIGKIFEDALKDFPYAIWGACPLTFSDYQSQYQYAAVILVPHIDQVTKERYSESRIYDAFHNTGSRLKTIREKISTALAAGGVDWAEPDILEADVNNGRSSLSAKYIAVQAGLGWIGKNDLLITPQYGPRLHMIPLLINGEIDVGTPTKESLCGECDICVQKCTYHALKGTLWKPEGVTRDDIVDFAKCRDGREQAKKVLGRRMTCAKCVAFCPVGIQS